MENKIAKLFNVPEPAVLLITTDPAIKFIMLSDDGIMVESNLPFKDTQEGFDTRDAAFKRIGQEEAEEFAYGIRGALS